MKSFVIRITENDEFEYIDRNDKAAVKRLLSSIRNSGVAKAKLTISQLESSTKLTPKQQMLFHVLVWKIAEHTGNDRQTVKTTLCNNLLPEGKYFEELSKREFNDFLEACCAFTMEFFDINVQFNSTTNEIELNPIR